ncbi:MAG: hypothetical protein JST28_23165 [Acidobacteria bacterium]|nr:hypothetical protein [Acidobacteriota bacterium]
MKASRISQRLSARIAQLLTIACMTGCHNQSHPSAELASLSTPDVPRGHNYSTQFPKSEKPIYEDGNWVVGRRGGSSLREGGHFWRLGRLWGDVQTNPGIAYGVDEPTEYGDPTAILTGVWQPDQTVSAAVRINRLPTGTCCHEVELRLRTTIFLHRITGYEAYCSVMPTYPYCHIARWNGPNGSYWNIEAKTPKTYVSNGDVLKATVTGMNPVVITLFKNGEQIAKASDTGAAGGGFGAFGPWVSGSPGIGFYDEHDNNWKDFGFSSFSATDNSVPAGLTPRDPETDNSLILR